MVIPVYKADLRRVHFTNQISHRPEPATFRSKSLTVRFDQPSQRRVMELAGYREEVADLECMISLDTGSAQPAPNTQADYILARGKTWRIIEVRPDQGSDCYHLTLTLVNE